MKKRTTLFALVAIALFLASCQSHIEDQPIQSTPVPQPDLSVQDDFAPLDDRPPLSIQEINALVHRNLLIHNIFNWNMVDDHVRWSALMRSDSLVSIGYQPEGYVDLNSTIHEVDVKDPQWQVVKDALISFIVDEENLAHPNNPATAEELLAFGDKELPYFNIKISRYETLAKLQRMAVVRYAEPMGYGTGTGQMSRSSSGCGGSADPNVPSSDFTTIAPNAKVSWNYYEHNIPAAWNHSTGDNIVVGMIDTGISPNQDNLNGNFGSGYSNGRFRQKYGFFVTGWWWWASVDGPNDDCGHGTSMAGTIAGPRSDDGSTVGVAYKCNFLSARGTDDVVINESREKDGVSDSYVYYGNRNDVKIISSSTGDVFSSGQVADAVRFANNKGKLIFSAAGTSLTWTSWWGVIFPANMSETVAVTGIKTGSSLQRCSTCHDGSAVDFVVVMEDAGNSSRTPITLHTSGSTPRRTGGSSIATATTAGIAALVWARNPSMNKSTVLQKLKEAAHIYPGRNGNFGWGKIDALAAVQSVP